MHKSDWMQLGEVWQIAYNARFMETTSAVEKLIINYNIRVWAYGWLVFIVAAAADPEKKHKQQNIKRISL